MDDADVIAGIQAALSVGSFSADVVAVEARKAGEIRKGSLPAPDLALAPPDKVALGPKVTPMLFKRVAELRDDDRPLPTVDAYDQLLRHRRSS
jgi:hypothetical protein